MGWNVTYHLVPLAVGIVTTVLVMGLVWKHRHKNEATILFLLFGGILGWATAAAVQIASTNPALIQFVDRFLMGFVSVVAVSWCAFAISYTEKTEWIRPVPVVLAIGVPVLTQIVVWTNSVHELMWPAGTRVTDVNGLVLPATETGIWFTWVHVPHSYGLLTIGAVLVARSAIRTWHVYRGQAIALLVGMIVPVVANGVFLLEITRIDYTPFAFTISALSIAWALFRYEFLTLLPVARETVVEEMRDGVIVLDQDDRIVDYNRAAASVLSEPSTGKSAIGMPATAALPFELASIVSDGAQELVDGTNHPSDPSTIGEALAGNGGSEFPLERDQQSIDTDVSDTEPLSDDELSHRRQFEHTIGDDTVIYRIDVVPISNHDGDSTGRILVLQDITELKEREAALRSLSEELELLNRIVRHDIQNDMNVVAGYADLLEDHLETARTDGDLDSTYQEYLEPIQYNTTHTIELTEQVGTLLEAITATEGLDGAPDEHSESNTLQLEPIELGPMIERELEKAHTTFNQATFTATHGESLEGIAVYGTPMLSSVFSNILSNAVRHTDNAQPQVHLETDVGASSVTVRIADDGPGIADDKKEAVFGRGERGLDSPGSGIGLYLVDRLTTAFGGSVHIEDNEPRGAVFVVTLERAL
ncbi:ATP-binding protein [Halobacteria archaeon AArc-curdl1]|uniref:histidine kinase n=1 Tax=Natronosalvus hydrolyticus TaxID=2979988 RepID=A0AAP2Z5H3_9EURY|nr:ATP-binding protein [Halobacteria archaeon AArc-curdl1]